MSLQSLILGLSAHCAAQSLVQSSLILLLLLFWLKNLPKSMSQSKLNSKFYPRFKKSESELNSFDDNDNFTLPT